MISAQLPAFLTRLTALLLPFSTVACCHTLNTLEADKTKAAVLVRTRPGSASGLVAPGWTDNAYQVAVDPSPCPHEKEKLEAALGIASADACADLRHQTPAVIGNGDEASASAMRSRELAPTPVSGDGDTPLPKPIAPHCYALGEQILVVLYEEPKVNCTHVVGIGVYPRK